MREVAPTGRWWQYVPMSSDAPLATIMLHLDSLLQAAGCKKLTSGKVRAISQDCWRGIRDDERAHGSKEDRPFFDFLVAENVGVFLFYDAAVDIYVVPGDEWTFREHFEKDLAMVDVAAARELLASRFAIRSAIFHSSGSCAASSL